MSVRRVGYDGRSPRVVDEGPASASTSDPMAMYGRLSAAAIPDPLGLGGAAVPAGGAGPVERRQATPEELAAARAREAPLLVLPMTIAELERRPVSAMSEAMLERGGLGRLGARTLVEGCACGGVIVAEDDSAPIADAVHVHNASTEHAQWAIGHGWRHAGRRA